LDAPCPLRCRLRMLPCPGPVAIASAEPKQGRRAKATWQTTRPPAVSPLQASGAPAGAGQNGTARALSHEGGRVAEALRLPRFLHLPANRRMKRHRSS
jgi:hypothetical protein